MSGFWLVSYVVLWVLVIGAALVVLALAREIELLHKRLEALQKFLSLADWGSDGRERTQAEEYTAMERTAAHTGSDAHQEGDR